MPVPLTVICFDTAICCDFLTRWCGVATKEVPSRLDRVDLLSSATMSCAMLVFGS